MTNSPQRILWLSNRLLGEEADTRSGTWLGALGPELSQRPEIVLANISFGSTKGVESMDYGDIKQWQVPAPQANKLPKEEIIKAILDTIKAFQPDLIQIWGVEQYWGRLFAAGLLSSAPVLVNIQGVMKSIVATYNGGLTFKEQLQCLGIRELIYPKDSIFGQIKLFKRLSEIEAEILASAQYITTQSKWSRAQVYSINAKAQYFHTERALRPEFYQAEPWSPSGKHNDLQLFSSSFGNPYKGFHVILRALAELKKDFPKLQLRVAGGSLSISWKNTGYNKFLLRQIVKLGLEDNIVWLGSLNAERLIEELQNAHCYLHSSFVESYSLAMAEALAIGTPAICSYAGALPEMSEDCNSVAYFPPGDALKMSAAVRELISNTLYAKEMSSRSRRFIRKRCDKNAIIETQLETYKTLLQKENTLD